MRELEAMFSRSDSAGIAIVCGEVSGMEGIDMDIKNDLTGALYGDFQEMIRRNLPGLAIRLVQATTRSNGAHWYYRCAVTEGSHHLASRPTIEEERKENPEDNIKVLIETCGEKGIIIVPPTPGYTFVQHDFSCLPVITAEEREQLLSVGRLFHQPKQNETEKWDRKYQTSQNYLSDDSPFDDYNKSKDVADVTIKLLEQHGWEIVETTPEKTVFRRPGHTDHHTSGDYNHKMNLFGVFSTSTQFKAHKGYKPSAVFAILECNSDFTLASKKLIQMGYGIPYKKQR